MKEQAILDLMERHGVKPTANRIIIVRTLSESNGPMSLAELEYKILTIDKSSISRALALFRKQHLVHTIESGESVRYELCLSHSCDKDDDRHVHFYCERCRRTTCLDDCPVPEVELPAGYVQISAEHIVRGICPDCNRK